jgi:diguanylate cyclase (GGDEF)-like protein
MSGGVDGATELRLPGVVSRIAHAILDGTSSDQLWRLAAHEVRKLFGCDAVIAFERVGSDRLSLRADTMNDAATSSVLLPFAPDSQAAFIFGQAHPVVVADLSAESRFTPGAILLERGFRSSVSCRIGREAEPLGVIGAFSMRTDAFDVAQAADLEVLASALGVGVIQSRRATSLQRRATIDSLTGIANRPTIVGLLEADLARAPGNHRFSHVVMTDLDGFKAINDKRGHGAGDEVLRCVAQRMESVVGPDNVVGRLGGDEFLVLVGVEATGQAVRVAEQIVSVVQQDIELADGAVVAVSGSVGVASLHEHDTATDALRRVDAAMYGAKHTGSGVVRLAKEPLQDLGAAAGRNQSRRARAGGMVTLDLATIEAAVAGMSVHLQPVVESRSMETVAFSAVARGPLGTPLHHPGPLFAQAATFGRLVDLELAVKRLAFHVPLPRQVGLFVKIDPAVFVSEPAMDQLIAAWDSSPLRNKLFVEVSVRSAAARPTELLNAIHRVRALGWGVAVDDFGHSLETLPVLRVAKPDVVKLDQSLTRPAGRQMVGPTMVALADYAEVADPVVIAKAIETQSQVDLARLIGADMLEGYQFGGPYPGELPLPGTDGELRYSSLDASRWTGGLGHGRAFGKATAAGTNSIGGSHHRPCMATKAQLLDLSRHLESFAITPDSVVLACLQRVANYTPRTRRQYQALARRAALVGVVGVDVGTGIENRVRLGSIAESSTLAGRWQVVVLSSTTSIALLAEEVDPAPSPGSEPTSRDRRFTFRLTTNRSEVEAAAAALLATM